MNNVIGVCGLIGSGKGTVADILVQNFQYEKISFADKLKDGVSAVFGWDRELLEGDTDRSRLWRERTDEFWTKETGTEVSPRLILQLFGTDCMRNGFYDGIWVSLVKQQILNNPDKKYIIPDVRFPNEMKVITELGGQVWQVRRGEMPEWFTRRQYSSGFIPQDVHESEWAWIDVDSAFDIILTNNGTLHELEKSVLDTLST
jgi:RecA/RadA recombinase